MDEAMFWTIIQRCDTASSGEMGKKCDLIKAEIARLSKSDAITFSQLFDAAMDRAYDWALWGAAYVINGGCGDDSFSDFRAALISRGQSAFKEAISDPDSLADQEFKSSSWFYEGFDYAVKQAVNANVGQRVQRRIPLPRAPSGSKWAEETVSSLYPKLARKFQ
jgi:hypothetical protein